MKAALVPSRESRMIAYFDGLQDDCYERYRIQDLYVDNWLRLGSSFSLLELAVGIVVTGVLIWAWHYIIIDLLHPLVLVLVLLLGSIIFFLFARAIEHDPRARGGAADDGGPRTGTGFVKRFHIPMADLADLARQTLRERKVPFDVFDIVLTERSGQPRGAVFDMTSSRVRMSLWKVPDDPYHTLFHLGPYNWRSKGHVRTLMGTLDGLVGP